MRFLGTHQAQSCVIAAEWAVLDPGKQRLWLALMMACASPGIPVDVPAIRGQMGYIWGAESTTYQTLLALGE